MNVLWQKIAADLFEHQARSLLAVLSLAAGLFAVGALFGMVDLQLQAMDAAHSAAIPSHINLILQRPVDSDQVSAVAKLPGVAAVEPVNQVSIRYRLGPDRPWILGTLVMRVDYGNQRFDRIQRVVGDWPGAGRLGVERLSAKAAGLAQGSSVELETLQGSQAYPVSGILRHPFVKPPAFGGQLHFLADAETFAAFGIPVGHYRQLLVRIDGDYEEARARRIAGEIRSSLGQAGVGVVAALLQDPERHWGRPFVAGINVVLQVMAVASLVLGALLILTATAARILQQTDQIGIMKSLGGRRAAIARIYLAETLALGLAATAVSLPAGLVAAWAGSRWFLDLFNIELERFTFSPRAAVIVLAGGILVPLVAAVGPVYRGAAMTIRAAIATYGVGADFGSGRFDRWVERCAGRWLPTLQAAALGNLFRRKGRLLLTELALVVAGVSVLVVMSLISSLNLTLDRELARTSYDLRLGFAAEQPASSIRGLAEQMPEITRFELWSRSPAELRFRDEPLRHGGTLGAQMIGLPAASGLYRPLIVAGRWLDGADATHRVLVLNAETARLSGLTVGDSVSVSLPGRPAEPWQVIGLYRWITPSDYAVEPVYVPQAALRADAGQPETAAQILIAAGARSLEHERELADRIKARFESAGIALDTYLTQSRLEQNGYVRSQFRPVLSMLLGLAAMMAAVGGIGQAGALSIAVMQRRREIGVLRSIGARTRTVFGLFLLEGTLQALMAWLVSLPPAWFLAPPLARRLGQTMLHIDLDYAFNGLAVLLWLGAVLTIAVLASIGPALAAARLSVRECLAYS